MQNVLKSYQKRLLNLTANNKSLLLRKLLKGQYIDIHRFDFIQKESSFSLIKKLIERKKNINISPILDSRDESVNLVSRDLTRLSRLSKFLFDEHGAKDLYIGWPYVKGKLLNGTHIHAPLLFFPVSIDKTNSNWILNHRSDVYITFNKSFLIAYGYYNNTPIEEELTEKDFEDFGTDPTVFRTKLYQFLKNSPLEINFNAENFTDRLTNFYEFTKQAFEECHKEGELKLFPEAILGIFPQSGSYLMSDYEEIQKRNSDFDLEVFFASKHNSSKDDTKYTFLNRVREDATYTPLKMDAYQENALKAAKLGKSFVVQGPPGTGKSQLISNLISDFLARGKRVLLVSQKRAALDVVYTRFNTLNLQNFIGLVHDFRNDRKEIYKKIGLQIDSIDSYKQLNNTLDAIQLEQQFSQYSRQIDSLTEKMEEFRTALFDKSECGISVKELYLNSNFNEKSIDVKHIYKHFNFSHLLEVITRSKRYANYASVFTNKEYVLLDRGSFSTYNISRLKRIVESIDEIQKVKKNIDQQLKPIINHPLDINDCLLIIDQKENIKELLSKLSTPQVYTCFKKLMSMHTHKSDFEWFLEHKRLVMVCFSGMGIEKSLNRTELAPLQSLLKKVIKKRKNILGQLWYLLSKDRKRINKILIANQLEMNQSGLISLLKMIDNRLILDNHLSTLDSKNWIKKDEKPISEHGLKKWYSYINEAFISKNIFMNQQKFNVIFTIDTLTYSELSKKIDILYKIINTLPNDWDRWLFFFTKFQLHKITTDEEWGNQVREVLERDFDSLCDFDILKESMPTYELTLANDALDSMKIFDNHNYEKLIINSLQLQWIEHIEEKYPILRAVSSQKFTQMEDDLQHNIKEKLKISKKIILLRVREAVYENIDYNRLNNMVTYRDIKHQVNKQRKIWPLRKLIAKHNKELFSLMPCWMGSPESVSAIFPMEDLFDIIIFDEASQCFSERGIPAMFRGKQLIVAGDNKQLRPNDLYKAKWENIEDENDELALEAESLLELCEQYLMNIQLKEHYRSKYLELIAFSNSHFYENSLRLLLDRKLANKHIPAIKYIKLDGVWEKNMNKVEAYKIIELIKKYTLEKKEKSIGVITFNAKQQELILDLLDSQVVENGFIIPKNLMVKNIENVQGDERDIIIFTMGYAPTHSGKMKMQFGSLNIAGGENRLNVAITRAREAIIMITSIWPDQLKVDDLQNSGPKLLKKYLTFAKQVSDGEFRPIPYNSDFQNSNWYLKNILIEYSKSALPKFKFKDELPFADITIKNGNHYKALLLTDDELYKQSPSVKDLHAYTHFTLSKNNWPFIGFFSREWWKNKAEVKEKIIHLLEQELID